MWFPCVHWLLFAVGIMPSPAVSSQSPQSHHITYQVVMAVVEAGVGHNFRTAGAVVPGHMSARAQLNISTPTRMLLPERTHLVVSVLLWWRRRLSVGVVGRLRARRWRVSVLLWRTGSCQLSLHQASRLYNSRRAIVLLWRRVSLRRRSAVLLRWWWAVVVVLLSRVVRHCGRGRW